VIFTDHGDGTRPPDAPAYIDGVLCVDAVEISTRGGHYIALGAAPSPYPLGGESEAVAEDIRRLGGFGVAAHPMSPRAELAWSDWSVPIDAIEWLNADSEWRDERRLALARAAAVYPLRGLGSLASLLDRPDPALSRWDALAAGRRVIAIAGHDAHGGIGGRVEEGSRGWRVPIPSYESSFATFSTRVELDRAPVGDAAADARALLDAIKAGRVFTVIDAVARGSTLEYTATLNGATVNQGGTLADAGPASFRARAAVPDGATIVALRNGTPIARAGGGAIDFEGRERGTYRVEVHVEGAPGTPPVPWLVSNPIFRLPPPVEDVPPASTPVLALDAAVWRVEKESGSSGTVRVDPGSGEAAFGYELRSGARVSQFAALVTDLPRDLPPFAGISFRGRSAAPQRVSVQLRFAQDGDVRWLRSAYIAPEAATITIPVEKLRPADGAAPRPDVRRATSLLFVVDLTNARPGDRGTIWVGEDVRLIR
jgi:hypothetical protein